MKKSISILSLVLLFSFSLQQSIAQPFTLLKDIFPGADGGYSTGLNFTRWINVNGTLYFTGNNGENGPELWKSDGTTEGTVMVKDILPGENGSNPQNFASLNGVLYFNADGGEQGNVLWKSDGTAEGTVIVKAIAGESSGMFYTTSIVSGNGLLFFNNDDGVHGNELWVSDGSEAGTVLLKDIVAGTGSASPSSPVLSNGIVYFSTQKQLWRTNGTEAGTQIVSDFSSPANQAGPAQLVDLNGVLFFTTYVTEFNPQYNRARLWKTNGTSAGTQLVKVISSAEETYVQEMINVDGTLYFIKMYGAFRGAQPRRYELWKSNGTTAGTIRIIPTAGQLFYGMHGLTAMTGKVYFSATNETYDSELWKSDGTPAGTAMVKDINPAGPSGPVWLVNENGALHFNAYDPVHGKELWKSDGTAAGTSLVQDIVPGPESSSAYEGTMGTVFSFPVVVKTGNHLFSLRHTTDYGLELWVSTLAAEECPPPSTILYVNTAATTSGSGSSWDCAIKELSEAVAIANNDATITQIWVAKGTYKPTQGADRTASILVNRGNLKLLGGFDGTETNAAAANPVANRTIISGDIGVAGDMSDNSYHLLRVQSVPASAIGITINGFFLEKGNADDRNIFTNENAYGGAIAFHTNNFSTNILVKRCLFTVNKASSAGGAVGVYNTGNLVFDSCIFMSNSASIGGAFASYSSTTTFKNTVFKQNIATTDNGGALEIYYGSASFTNTVFDRNSAKLGGGAIHQQEAGSTYLQCVFSENTASGGGAIFQQSSASQIASSTFFANSGDIYAGGIGVNGPGSSISCQNSIFWKNKIKGLPVPGLEAPDVATRAGGVLVGFANNLLQLNGLAQPDNGTTVINNIRGIDPLFVNENVPSGSDDWFGYLGDGLELKNASPAKNTGDNNYATGLLVDILGKNRIACSTVDIGAYENQTCPVLIANSGRTNKEFTKKHIEASVTNPFHSQLLIRYTGPEKAEVDITSLSGQKMWKGTAIQKGQTQVNTVSWPSGLYQVTVRTASSKPIVLKVIKVQ